MKFKLLSVAILAAFALASCSKDGGGEKPIDEESGTPTLVQISVIPAGANTKAHYGVLAATSEESTIKSVSLYIFNSLGVLEAREDFAANLSTRTFMITSGTKTFFALANMSANLPATTVGTTTMNSFKNEVTATIADMTVLATDDEFWMTTQDFNTTFTLDANITEASQVPGSANELTLPVGRAAAKIGVYFNSTTNIDGILHDVKYKVKNNPNKFQIVPHHDAGGLWVTPHYQSLYVPGNYFHNTAWKTTDVDMSNEHEATSISYMMENSNKDAQKGNATMIMVQGVFVPDPTVWYDVTTDALDPTPAAKGDDFWRIANVDGSGNVLSYEARYYSDDPADISSVVTIGANQAVVKYTGGECFYGMWLTDTSADSKNKYTVKRNTYWSVEITAVNGAGANDEDKVITEPTDPLDVDVYMSANITVMPWVGVSQSGGI